MADPAFEFLAAPAFLGILIVAWAVAAVLVVVGRARGRPRWTGGGAALLGALVLVSGLSWALGTWPSDASGYPATPGDLAFLGLLGFVGGIVAAFGATIASWGGGSRRESRSGADPPGKR